MNPKNKIIKSSERYEANHGWLQSFHLFSFASYYDPQNISFWNLRVFNDDYIKWKSGFWLHPHDNMEILTIVLEGSVTHTDTLWNKEKTQSYEIQTMSAGTGLFHSETNEEDETLHLYQLWFLPEKRNIVPTYKNKKIELTENSITHLYGNLWNEEVNSDVNIWRGIYENWKTFEYTIKDWEWLFLYLTNWKLLVNNEIILSEKDQLRYTIPWKYIFTVQEKSDFILGLVKI